MLTYKNITPGGVVVSNNINLISQGLDGALNRHKMLSNNIANVDTPNYKRKDVDFITALRNQFGQKSSLSLATTDNNHIVGSKKANKSFESPFLKNTSYRNDKNNVDIDVEMGEVAKNGIYYNTLSRQINTQFIILKDVINKGGRQ